MGLDKEIATNAYPRLYCDPYVTWSLERRSPVTLVYERLMAHFGNIRMSIFCIASQEFHRVQISLGQLLQCPLDKSSFENRDLFQLRREFIVCSRTEVFNSYN